MQLRPIEDVAHEIGLGPDDLVRYGRHIAKISPDRLRALASRPPSGRIVLVSAINPTKHGEGKTTVSIGLAQGLRRIGKRVMPALREPSLGPIFGIKGGGTGGGQSKLEPSATINLHLTGDLHAITAAHNLLASLVDNAVYFRAPVEIDHRRITWRRVLDMNDRFLRNVVIGLGGKSHGVPREDGFDITAASEVMAILCLARDIPDLKARLGRVLVGFDRDGKPVTAKDLGATGAMAALLRDALLPNLVQTREGGPAFVHGGPFGNIAHGCSSIVATRAAAALADYVVTEAGFGFDLGAEKFFDIKCRAAGVWPRAVVLVVTAAALRAHGGDVDRKAHGDEALMAIERGLANLDQHLANVRRFGFDPVIAINCFARDDEAELATIERACSSRGVPAARFRGFAEGGAGAEDLARLVVEAADRPASEPRFLYGLDEPPIEKIRKIATAVYGARDVELTRDAKNDVIRAMNLGYGGLPICVAKTHLSLSDDPNLVGRPSPFVLTVRQVRVVAGAGYLLALTGDIVTMPGLPAKPASSGIDLTDDGVIVGIE